MFEVLLPVDFGWDGRITRILHKMKGIRKRSDVVSWRQVRQVHFYNQNNKQNVKDYTCVQTVEVQYKQIIYGHGYQIPWNSS